MYSSVKFFDPMVSVTLPLSGLDAIRLSVSPDAPVVVVSSSPPPHAAIVTARAAATSSRNAARTRRPLITPYPLSSLDHWATGPITGILCGAGDALQFYASRRHQPLHAGQGELDQGGEHRDDDRARQHAVVAIDAAVGDEVPKGGETHERGDGRRGEDVDGRGSNPGHDRRRGERQLNSQDHLP